MASQTQQQPWSEDDYLNSPQAVRDQARIATWDYARLRERYGEGDEMTIAAQNEMRRLLAETEAAEKRGYR